MSVEIDIRIERLFTAKLMSKLSSQARTDYQANLEARLKTYYNDLNHSTKYLSQDACLAPLTYYLSIDDHASITALIKHQNKYVVSTALGYFTQYKLTNFPLPLYC